jgi:hypothetical protein
VVALEGIEQAVPQHGVDELEVAHFGAGAHVGGMRGHRHGLLAARYDDVGVAVGDLLHPNRDGAQPRTAKLIEAPGGLFRRDAGSHGGLTGRVLTRVGGQHLAENYLVDLARIDPGALQRRRDRNLAEFMRRCVREGAVEGSHRGARRRHDHDVAHRSLLSLTWLTVVLRRF